MKARARSGEERAKKPGAQSRFPVLFPTSPDKSNPQERQFLSVEFCG